MGDLSPGLYQYQSSKLHVIGNVNSTSLENKQGAGKGPTAWLQHPAAPTPTFCRSVGFSEAARESGGGDSKDSPEAMVSQEEQAVKKISAWKMPTRRMKKRMKRNKMLIKESLWSSLWKLVNIVYLEESSMLGIDIS